MANEMIYRLQKNKLSVGNNLPEQKVKKYSIF